MNKTNFGGTWTALVTPFLDGDGISNEVDYKSLETLLEMQVNAGVTGILFLGTTGENPTITKEEGEKIVKFAIEKLKGRVKIMVNLGTYSTLASLENTKRFDGIEGIDAYLAVNPYYNKPTQTGLYKHFKTIADSTKRPVMIYNIEGRTGVNLQTETLVRIANECSNLIGVKESSGDLNQMKEVIEKTDDDFVVLSGDDGMTLKLIKIGGDGCISVASNCIPKEIVEFVNATLNGEEKGEKLGEYYNDFFKKLFIQTNPLPAKTFLSEKGIIKEEYRLPMCRMDEKEKEDFLEAVNNYNF